MDIFETSLEMLRKYPLCDRCLGRQFAMLGYNLENFERGRSLKLVLTLQASALAQSRNEKGHDTLQVLAKNGFFLHANATIVQLGNHSPSQNDSEICYLCESSFKNLDKVVRNVLRNVSELEYATFLAGIILPIRVEEREDEFRAEFQVNYGESVKHEFGRSFGKRIAEKTGKAVEFMNPDIVILINPFEENVKIQVNPLFVLGRYKKLVRDMPQSIWFCSNCRGKGCDKCDFTGKLYSESVEELISKPFLEATKGEKTSFHASGREDIDVRMLGNGRPFVIEVTKPKKRFLDLAALERTINNCSKGKIEVMNLRNANRDDVRRLKKAESSRKEYRVTIKFKDDLKDTDLVLLEEALTNTLIKQRTPLRVLHRRADLTRERYIYEVKVKRCSSKKAEMDILCQGGLYIKELVTGDEGRTACNVSGLLGNEAKPIQLDVLRVIMNT